MRPALVFLLLLLSVAAPRQLGAQVAASAPDTAGSDGRVAAVTRNEGALPSRTRSALLQLPVGTASGLAATAVAAIGLIAYAGGRYVTGHSTDLNRGVDVLAYSSYVTGSAVGVYWAGRARGHRGRFLPTLLGSAIGLGSPGATLAYHLSDRSRTRPAGTGEMPASSSVELPRTPSPRVEVVWVQVRF